MNEKKETPKTMNTRSTTTVRGLNHPRVCACQTTRVRRRVGRARQTLTQQSWQGNQWLPQAREPLRLEWDDRRGTARS